MKPHPPQPRPSGWASVCLLLPLLLIPAAVPAAAFVEMSVEVELHAWSTWLGADQDPAGLDSGGATPADLFSTTRTVQCVVGPDFWMLRSESANADITHWFTGSNLVERVAITRESPLPQIPGSTPRPPIVAAASPAQPGQEFLKRLESVDGNPGRPVRQADLMGTQIEKMVCWLALGSASTLKREGRTLYPPSGFWKHFTASAIWSDTTRVFEDELGLPRSVDLVTPQGQALVQYRVRRATNVLGNTFPALFQGIQYSPSGTNAWQVHMTWTGRVTQFRECAKPSVPVK